jgi:hypothetical protein
MYNDDTALGIYKIEGNILTIANQEPGVLPRPTSFAPTGNFRYWVLQKSQ